jgi:hypothetical protein
MEEGASIALRFFPGRWRPIGRISGHNAFDYRELMLLPGVAVAGPLQANQVSWGMLARQFFQHAFPPPPVVVLWKIMKSGRR